LFRPSPDQHAGTEGKNQRSCRREDKSAGPRLLMTFLHPSISENPACAVYLRQVSTTSRPDEVIARAPATAKK
jgi:hypothetical protein